MYFVFDGSFVVAVAKELGTVVLDITGCTEVNAALDEVPCIGNGIVVIVRAFKRIVAGEIGLLVELVGTHCPRRAVIATVKHRVPPVVVGVVVSHRDILPGGREVVVRACQFVPCIVGQTVVVLVFHNHHGTGFRPHALYIGSKRVAMDRKIHTIGVVRVVDNRLGKFQDDIAAEAAQRSDGTVRPHAVGGMRLGKIRPDELPGSGQEINHSGSVGVVHCRVRPGYRRHG